MRHAMIRCSASVWLLLALPVYATNTQQDKMTTCNASAKTQALTGDARKAFMKSCLSADGDTTAPTSLNSQQQKMKTCNASAKTQALSGDARKAFMKTCLSGN